MYRMGSACSLQRQRTLSHVRAQRRNENRPTVRKRNNNGQQRRSSLRHSVVSAIPDGSIATLYPVEDNYVNAGDGKRSPKSLAELATDAVCRSLPYLNGCLPPGLPQDVMDDIVHSLIRHSALNPTTLRAIRNCEFGKLSLAGCRGVTDEWLEPLSPRYKAVTPPASPDLCPLTNEDGVESMDLDERDAGTLGSQQDEQQDPKQQHPEEASASSSSCSTSSFVSARSHHDSHENSDMTDANQTGKSQRLVDPTEATEPTSTWSSSNMEGMMISSHKRPSSLPPTSIIQSVTSNLTLLDLRGSQRLTDRGLLQLTDLGRLEVARLDNCHSLVGRGLIALSSSHQLHTLSLANCRRLTDEAIINISHLLSLETLSVDGCRCLTDRSLAAISDLYALRRLDLSQCDLITDSGLEHLEHLESLEELSLGWCRLLTDGGLDDLTSHTGRDTNLRVFRLARCNITDAGVEHLTRLKALEELDLSGCSSIGSSALGQTLERLPKLTTLDVSYCPGILRSGWQGKIDKLKSLELCYATVKDSHLRRLSFLPALEELNLDSCPVGDSTLDYFASHDVVPNLLSLDLADTNLTDAGMAHIAKFRKLKRLSLFYCNISNSGLRHIANLSQLEVLNLDSREISDDGLRHLRKLSNLKSLDLFSGRVTDLGCSHISKISSLEALEICGGGVGDLGCNLLASLENLKSLNLSQNERITNRGAAALATLSELRTLNLSNTRVNSEALRFFNGLRKLQSLALYGCRGIEHSRGLVKLQSELPSLKCLRLNNVADEDGMAVTGTSFDSDSDDDHDDDNGYEDDEDHEMSSASMGDN